MSNGKKANVGGHYYPGCKDDDDFFTSDCEHGCGCWMGGTRSGGPDGVDPFGACPNNEGIDCRKPTPFQAALGVDNQQDAKERLTAALQAKAEGENAAVYVERDNADCPRCKAHTPEGCPKGTVVTAEDDSYCRDVEPMGEPVQGIGSTRRLALDVEITQCGPGPCHWCFRTNIKDEWACGNPDHPDYSAHGKSPRFRLAPGETFPKDCPLLPFITPAPEELYTVAQWFEEVFEILDDQETDQGLMTEPEYASEAYMQEALKRIHQKLREARTIMEGR